MSSEARIQAQALEAFLARLYVDAELRSRFVAEPLREARAAGVSDEDARRLCAIDREGLAMAATSFAFKRSAGR